MANLKDIKRRIGSVKNTQQITKAMKLVAAAKLRRTQESVMASRPYSQKVAEVMESVAAAARENSHPLLRRKKDPENILIIVMSGDKGLCGPFNTNVLKAASKVIADNHGKGVSLLITGKNGIDFFRRRNATILKAILDYGKKLGYDLAGEIATAVTEEFLSGRVDKVYMVYNRFRNVVVQIPTTISLLPVAIAKRDEHAAPPVDFEYEPSEAEILNEIFKRYIESQIFQSLLESAASENGARMTAMDAATKNAKDMIEKLTLQYNRARQAAITTEIIEVVTGADAIK
jgi:F-type H+-transporting ATPase subunit gamma